MTGVRPTWRPGRTEPVMTGAAGRRWDRPPSTTNSAPVVEPARGDAR